MKQRWLVLFAALLVTAALACKKTETYNSDTASTSTTSSDTSGTTSTYDTSGTSSTAATGMTGATGMSGATSSMDPADNDFMTKATQGGLAEVDMGNMAASKADVKAFGNRMVTDHSKANDELKQLAATKGVVQPGDVNDEQKKTMDALSSKSGKDFDKAYMDDMVKDHETDVKEFEKASKNAKDADLKAWATKTLPTLQEHLKMAKDAQKKVK